MPTEDKLIETFVDLLPNQAKKEALRLNYEAELKEQLVSDVPKMVSRLAELDAIITREVGEYIYFMREAVDAFQYGLWRSVVALIGIAAESFTDTLYDKFKHVTSTRGTSVVKQELFGRDDYMPEQRKLTVLFVFGIIEAEDYEKLRQIKKLRDQYIHPGRRTLNIEEDARKIIRLFRSIIKDRFERVYTIRQGKIVKR